MPRRRHVSKALHERRLSIQRDRRAVWKGEKRRTRGGLTKEQLKKKANGHIVGRRASLAAKRRFHNPKYAHVKHAFNANKISRRRRSKSKSHRRSYMH